MREKCLIDCELKKNYLISKIKLEDKNLLKYLECLMIVPNQKIKLLYRSFKDKAMIIKVLEINYAIDRNICRGIFVYDD